MSRSVEMEAGTGVAAELAAARELITPGLTGAADRLDPALRRVVGFHFGWCDERGRPADGDPGKAVRPALVSLSARAMGGTAEAAAPAAVAVELAHNFTLLHDDVMDADRTRRHRPTAWALFGVPAAILAGDALLALAIDVLAAGGPATEGMRPLAAAVARVLGGQAEDVAFERRSDVGLAECLDMAAAKTGALMGCSCELGALSAGAEPTRVAALREFGEHVGLAFQLVDDLLGIWGEPSVTGKPVRSDLRARKKSLPVVAALGAGTGAAARLATLYDQDAPLTEPELREAAELVAAAGGRDWARRRAAEELDAALSRLTAADPQPAAGALLADLARLLGERQS
jgi:geranylgeranyl diphosphate synthase, type I